MSLSKEGTNGPVLTRLSGFQEDLGYIRGVSLFQGLEYECLKLLAMLSRRVEYGAGDQLMVQGEEGENAFLVLSGRLAVDYSDGGQRREICDYKEGKFIGGCALFDRISLIFSLQAKEKTVVLQLSREDFQKVVRQFPTSTSRVAANLVCELAKWDKNLLAIHKQKEELDYKSVGVSLL